MTIFSERKWDVALHRLCRLLGCAWERKTDRPTQKKYLECARCGAVKRADHDRRVEGSGSIGDWTKTTDAPDEEGACREGG